MKKHIFTLIIFTFVIGISASVARTISGVVKGDGKPLSGVVVTDGYGFATTDNKGSYKLDLSSEARFVYLATPSGYTAPYDSGTPVFYREVKDKVNRYDFALLPYGNVNSYTLIATADPQTQNKRHFNRFSQESIPDLKATVDKLREKEVSPTGICLGDIAWDVLSYFDKYKSEIKTLGIPFYPVIGNHDHNQHAKGDVASAEQYYQSFGPGYYAFNLGEDYYVVLDNIIYNTQKRYETEVEEKQLSWLKNYLEYVPKGSHVVVCMHAPVHYHYIRQGLYMKTSKNILQMLKEYKPRFMTGHSHMNSNFYVAPNVVEHNVASIGGAWWTARVSKDGTPCGYQIFTSDKDGFSWQYKSVDKPIDCQFKLYDRGTFVTKSNAVVAKIWNWDTEWQVEWFEDGKAMGEMERFNSVDPDYMRYLQKRRDDGKKEVGAYKRAHKSFFYFVAEPSIYAKKVKVVATDRFGRSYEQTVKLNSIDVQAHRGGIGVMPENTTEAMINAIKLGVNTLELDLNISKDHQVVVSHDPWMNYKFVTKPDGSFINKDETKEYALYRMTYDSIKTYDTGLKAHPDFPKQKKIKTYKPLVSDLIDEVEKFTTENGYSPIYYNIEIKSSVSRDGVYSPDYRTFTDLVMEVLLSKNLGDRLLVQCFDVRTLNYLHNKYPKVRLSYLVDSKGSDFKENMALLTFVPECYSPHHSLVTEESIKEFHEKGVTIVPWTVDNEEDIKRMIELGVDGIISNYPDRVLALTRKY